MEAKPALSGKALNLIGCQGPEVASLTILVGSWEYCVFLLSHPVRWVPDQK